MRFNTPKFFVAIVFTFLLLSCGTDSTVLSKNKDVASAMSEHGNQTYLYWHEGESLNRAMCEPQKPLLRRYCQSKKVSLPWTKIESEVYGNRYQGIERLEADQRALQAQLKAIDEALDHEPASVDLSRERERVAKDLLNTSTALVSLQSELDAANAFLRRLKDDSIVYRMFHNDSSYLKEKPFLAIIEQAFKVLQPGPPTGPTLPSEPASLRWTDPVTARSYSGFLNLLTYDNALAACQSIQPGHWQLLTTVTDRLLASALFAAVPFEFSGHQKFVWTFDSDRGELQSAIWVEYGTGAVQPHSQIISVVEGSMMPTICEEK